MTPTRLKPKLPIMGFWAEWHTREILSTIRLYLVQQAIIAGLQLVGGGQKVVEDFLV